MRKNYVLIDFENVQPESLAALQQDHFEIKIFLGATQTKISFEIAQAMQTMGPRAEYIKMGGTGSNALDFHIAYYIGHLSAKDPTAYFHIISKDTGFDPLIAHLKSKNISAAREPDIGDIPLVKATPLVPALPVAQLPLPPPQLIVRHPEPLRLKPSPKPPATAKPVATPAPAHKPDERFSGILQNLRLLKAAKPRKVKTLTSHIKTLFHNAITEAEIAHLIADMRAQKKISITDSKITYHL
jgi:PIN domain